MSNIVVPIATDSKYANTLGFPNCATFQVNPICQGDDRGGKHLLSYRKCCSSSLARTKLIGGVNDHTIGIGMQEVGKW
ncbi:MAG: hypothetical protein KTR18_06705 [Acidiferrobacterales bacterium]|nr:hypothetical protein [Acidiferrobacterales bacterium]